MIPNRHFRVLPDGRLEFNEDVIHPEPDVRRLKDAGNVLYKEVPLDDRPLYYMYRDVHFAKDADWIKKSGIRYDITVILPGTIEGEFIKTVGHFHPLKPGSNDTYPEYYEVLSGRALYLLQKKDENGDVAEFIAVEAQAGDKVFIPPNYGHITVNPGTEPLVMANLIEATFKSDYGPFAAKRGAAYYVLQDNGSYKFVRNQNYRNQVPVTLRKAAELSHPTPAVEGRTLYEALIEMPEELEFLK